jgi:hypothetical protein
MSVFLDIGGTLEPNNQTNATPVRLTSTAITDVYTALDNLSVLVAVQVANETAGAVDVLIDHYDGTTNWHTWATTFAAAKGSVTLADFPVRLLTGHKIKATASVANQITVSVAIVKTAGRNISGGGA